MLGLSWLLLSSLISSLPGHALPSQANHVLLSAPVDFVEDGDWDLLPRDLLRRAYSSDLEGWDLYEKYQTRKKNAPSEPLPAGLTATAAKATRRDDPKNPRYQLYTFNDRTVNLTAAVLGKGGDGTVYTGIMDGKAVAVKVSPSRKIAQAGIFMVALRDSPYVLQQLELFRGEDREPGTNGKRAQRLFQVMPLLQKSLAAWLDNVSDDEWQQYHPTIAQQALQGLVDMHEKGIAHRDYKPDNIFLANKAGRMEAVVADLDRATELVDTLKTSLGTEGYTPLGKHRGD